MSVLPIIEKVKAAIFYLCPESVARPDGFNGTFYQQCWDIVCNDVFEVVLGVNCIFGPIV